MSTNHLPHATPGENQITLFSGAIKTIDMFMSAFANNIEASVFDDKWQCIVYLKASNMTNLLFLFDNIRMFLNGNGLVNTGL